MKISDIIHSLKTVKDHDEDYDVAWLLFTINDIKTNFQVHLAHKDDECKVIERLQEFFDNVLFNILYDEVNQIVDDVNDERFKNETDYKLYLELKERFENK